MLACKGTERIAIEIETGKSDVVTNVRQDLLSGFTSILVVATDQAAMGRIEKQLGTAGLLIPGRVNLIIQSVWRNKYDTTSDSGQQYFRRGRHSEMDRDDDQEGSRLS